MTTTYNTEVKDVLEKYNINYTMSGIEDNLNEWQRNKAGLINLLRKHPNWNEEALAVIFEVKENREIDNRQVREYRGNIYNLACLLGMTKEIQDNFYWALCAATDEYNKILLSECSVERIKQHSGVICVPGQKTSRIINKICKKFGIDKHPEFNARFAKLADSLNPLQVKKTALLSVHPCDYLEMSNRNNSWSSCHCLTDGGYSAGTLSYMNDGVSMIFYTVDENVTSDYYKAPKRTREVFCYGDGVLLQSRLYPKTHDEATKDVYRNIVQQTITACLNVPNLWILKKEQTAVDQYCQTHSDAMHYTDYTYNDYKANVSLLKSVYDENNNIYIGYTAYCVDCSEELREPDGIACEYCGGNRCTCADCGETIYEDNVRWVGGEPYCNDCVSYCGYCNEYTRDDMRDVHDRRGNQITVCENCHDDYFDYCEGCEEDYHRDNGSYINGEFYCNNCLEDDFTICPQCGEYVRDNDAVEIQGSLYCESCRDNHFYYCEECDEYYRHECGSYVDNDFYCSNCLEDKFAICHDCGEYARNDDAIEIDNCLYCESCAENIEIENENERECA